MKEEELDPTKTNHQYINYDPDDEDSQSEEEEDDDSETDNVRDRSGGGKKAVGFTVSKLNLGDGVTTNNDFKSQTISSEEESEEGIKEAFDNMYEQMKNGTNSDSDFK